MKFQRFKPLSGLYKSYVLYWCNYKKQQRLHRKKMFEEKEIEYLSIFEYFHQITRHDLNALNDKDRKETKKIFANGQQIKFEYPVYMLII